MRLPYSEMCNSIDSKLFGNILAGTLMLQLEAVRR